MLRIVGFKRRRISVRVLQSGLLFLPMFLGVSSGSLEYLEILQAGIST